MKEDVYEFQGQEWSAQNGQQSIRIEIVIDYEKKKDVHQHYLLIKKDVELRIAELKWDCQ